MGMFGGLDSREYETATFDHRLCVCVCAMNDLLYFFFGTQFISPLDTLFATSTHSPKQLTRSAHTTLLYTPNPDL